MKLKTIEEIMSPKKDTLDHIFIYGKNISYCGKTVENPCKKTSYSKEDKFCAGCGLFICQQCIFMWAAVNQ